jgi:hypothetical protein
MKGMQATISLTYFVLFLGVIIQTKQQRLIFVEKNPKQIKAAFRRETLGASYRAGESKETEFFRKCPPTFLQMSMSLWLHNRVFIQTTPTFSTGSQ